MGKARSLPQLFPGALLLGALLFGALLFGAPALAVQFVYRDGEAPADAEAPLPPPAAPANLPPVLPPAQEMTGARRGATMPGAAAPGRARPEAVAGPAPVDPEPAGRLPAPAAEHFSELPAVGEGAWVIPPIRWGGSVGYALQRTSSDNGQRSLAHNLFTNLSATSYLYAPWAATISGRLGLSTGAVNGSSGFNGVAGENNRNSTLIGGVDLNVFPNSRFPFQAYFDRTDSRASGTLVNNDYVNTRFGLRQNYRSEDGSRSAGGQLDHSTVVSEDGNDDTLTALAGNFSTNIGIVRNSIDGRYSLGQRRATGERARLLGVNTTHNANFGDNVALSGNVNYLDDTLRTGNGFGSLAESRTRFLQLNALGTWMPEFEEREDLPLTLSGGLRYGSLTSEFAGQSIDSQNVGANANALYRFSNNLTVGGNAAINRIATSNGGPDLLLTLLGTSVNYAGDPRMFGATAYNWNVGGNANWQSASGTIPSDSFVGVQANHTLSRVLPLSESTSLSLSVSQGINTSRSELLGASNSLLHTVAASYGLRWGEQFSATSTLSFSDILTTGVNAQHYRMLGLGFNGVGQLSPYSSANVNLQFNWNQQKIEDTQNFGFASDNNQRMTLLGSASYTHSRFLGVRGLRQTLLFAADTRMRDDRLLGNVNGQIERSRSTLSNRLDYRYGLLDFRATAAINDVGGRKNALLFFQVTRQIGAY